MSKSRLDPKLVTKLATKLDRAESSIRSSISQFAAKRGISSEAALVLLCKQNGIGSAAYLRGLSATVQGQVASTSSSTGIQARHKAVSRKLRPAPRKKKLLELVKYSTSDPFRKGHIEEINKAYTHGCYTCVFVLLRKIVENMLIDILRFRFPDTTKVNKELYFDIAQKRVKDFGSIVKNFRAKSNDFGIESKLVQRIADRAKDLKDEANDKAHSWFHLVTRKSEIIDIDPQNLIDLIDRLEISIGMSK